MKTLVELAKRVRKYVDIEEFLKTKNSNRPNEGSSRNKQKQEILKNDAGKRTSKAQQKGGRDLFLTTFTPLSLPIQEVMAATEIGRASCRERVFRAV